MEFITWKDKLKEWKKNPLKYPDNLTKAFFWQTKCITSLKDNYVEEFIENKRLDIMEENSSFYSNYIKSSTNKYATSFYNLSKTSILIIPIPRTGKKFTTLKHFIDNASLEHQKKFWKYVSKEIKSFLKQYGQVCISTHGLGVPYLHIRLDQTPKYYSSK